MFEVIVMVCLAATGEQCTEYKLPNKEYRDVVTCIRESHAAGSAWQSENTKYTIIGTRCTKDSKAPDAPNS
jgi:hypothetical protein